MSEILEMSAVHKSYGEGTPVLNGATFSIHPGDRTFLVGPSGSGKSTILNIAAGLVKADSGSVKLCGVDLSGASYSTLLELRRERIGYVFQKFNLVSGLTVEENVILPSLLAGKPKHEALTRCRELLEAVELAAKANSSVATLSRGEQQRVAICRALINSPSIIFADEPTGNLDERNASLFMGLLCRIVDASGCGALIATHNLALLEYGNRVLTLKAGTVREEAC
ncbi:MAG TPA: ABC transporter ATP-binding protein [Firmicutes bacterium]|nr:ABC transporter ATP-binding protein [Candidatus Fermentithermobacillaceae bacterium]